MTTFNDDVDYVSAPKDAAEFFKIYYDYTVNFVAKLGIHENNAHDVASEIMLRFLERGSLEKFDPTLNFTFQGENHPARFKSYYSRSVDLYTRGHREKIARLAHRELKVGGLTAPATEAIYDVHEDHADGVHDMVDEDLEARGVRTLLARVPARNANDRCDLVALYDAVRAQINAYGEYDIQKLRDKFQVSTTAMHGWMWWLKENLAHIYGIPMPAKRPRRTRSAPA